MRRSGRFDKGVLLLLLIVAILAATGVFLYTQIRTDKIAEAIKKNEPIKVAIIVDAKDKLLFTEVLVINPVTSRGALFDIPGNVGSLIESMKKIAGIDVLYHQAHVAPFRDKVGSLLGAQIPFSIQIDLSDVPKIVDLLGGLQLFLPSPVEQTSRDPMVLLPSGNVRLDGDKVRSYITYQDPNETDVEVINRHLRFVQALLQSIGQQTRMLTNPEVYPYLKSFLRTNMNRRSLVSFVNLLGKLNTQRLAFQRVLGVKRLVDSRELLFPHYDGNLLRETWGQTLASLANPQAASQEPPNVRLQILNGTLIGGLAHRTAEIFQSFGYDVVAVGNADHQNHEKTVIIDHSDDLSQAQRVASVIRCSDVENASGAAVTAQTGGAILNYDITIILGKDFDGRYCK